jgi:Rod binding domain-containing protein
MEVGSLGKATDIDMMNINSTTANRLSSAQKAKALAKGASEAKIDEVANEFESQFISQMLQNMFSTVDTDGPLGGGDAEETYRSMLVNEYGKLVLRSGGIGVADHVKREMLRLQEVK